MTHTTQEPGSLFCVMQWSVCCSHMSAPLPAHAVWETCERIVLLLVFIS